MQNKDPAAGRSEIKVTIKLTRGGSAELGGSWFAATSGGIRINGENVWTWTRDNTALPVPATPGTRTIKEATVSVEHRAEKSVDFEADYGKWYNSTYSSMGCEWGRTEQKIQLEALQAYTLTVSEGENAAATVKRGPEVLSSGASVYGGEELTVEGSASAGYTLALTVNGNAAESGDVVTVEGDMRVEATATLRPAAYVKYTPYIGTAEGWERLS